MLPVGGEGSKVKKKGESTVVDHMLVALEKPYLYTCCRLFRIGRPAS